MQSRLELTTPPDTDYSVRYLRDGQRITVEPKLDDNGQRHLLASTNINPIKIFLDEKHETNLLQPDPNELARMFRFLGHRLDPQLSLGNLRASASLLKKNPEFQNKAIKHYDIFTGKVLEDKKLDPQTLAAFSLRGIEIDNSIIRDKIAEILKEFDLEYATIKINPQTQTLMVKRSINTDLGKLDEPTVAMIDLPPSKHKVTVFIHPRIQADERLIQEKIRIIQNDFQRARRKLQAEFTRQFDDEFKSAGLGKRLVDRYFQQKSSDINVIFDGVGDFYEGKKYLGSGFITDKEFTELGKRSQEPFLKTVGQVINSSDCDEFHLPKKSLAYVKARQRRLQYLCQSQIKSKSLHKNDALKEKDFAIGDKLSKTWLEHDLFHASFVPPEEMNEDTKFGIRSIDLNETIGRDPILDGIILHTIMKRIKLTDDEAKKIQEAYDEGRKDFDFLNRLYTRQQELFSSLQKSESYFAIKYLSYPDKAIANHQVQANYRIYIEDLEYYWEQQGKKESFQEFVIKEFWKTVNAKVLNFEELMAQYIQYNKDPGYDHRIFKQEDIDRLLRIYFFGEADKAKIVSKLSQ